MYVQGIAALLALVWGIVYALTWVAKTLFAAVRGVDRE